MPARAPEPPHRRRWSLPELPGWAVVILLAVTIALQYPDLASLPFVGDDYLFLDKTGWSRFVALWVPWDLNSGFYRPWSREFHFWVLQRFFGVNSPAFHLANLVLWVAALSLYFGFARRIAGVRVATWACAAVAAIASWGVLLTWSAGCQDLWMILFGLGFLECRVHGWRAATALALLLALLSKETAVVLPAVAAAYDLTVGRLGIRTTLRRMALPVAIVVAWATLHPMLGGRWWGAPSAHPIPSHRSPVLTLALSTLLGAFNLDTFPEPFSGWVLALLTALVPTALLVALTAWGAESEPADSRKGRASREVRESRARTMQFGLVWSFAAWLPLAHPAIGLHAYYGTFGILGACLMLAAAISHRRRAAMILLAGIALLRPGRSDTPSLDWGTEWYQRRAGVLSRTMHDDLKRIYPALPPHSRVFFGNVPGGTGLVAGPGNSPALRVWYQERTLRGGFFTHYAPRGEGDSLGIDVFVMGDSTGHWTEILRSPHDPGLARHDPRSQDAHAMLAETFHDLGYRQQSREEFARLFAAFPGRYEYAFNAGLCSGELGDSLAAVTWFDRAVAVPGVPADRVDAARQFRSVWSGRR